MVPDPYSYLFEFAGQKDRFIACGVVWLGSLGLEKGTVHCSILGFMKALIIKLKREQSLTALVLIRVIIKNLLWDHHKLRGVNRAVFDLYSLAFARDGDLRNHGFTCGFEGGHTHRGCDLQSQLDHRVEVD